MFSKQFDDIYFSREDGLAESRHTYLAGNGLPAAWLQDDTSAGFNILELGFGSGLNFLATLEVWQRTVQSRDKTLTYTAVEKYPLPWPEIEAGLAGWQDELGEPLRQLGAAYPNPIVSGIYDVAPGVRLDLRIGDVADVLDRSGGGYDAIYLDGFAPSKNPEMWTQEIFDRLMLNSHKTAGWKTTLATFSVAKAVQSGLWQAGFVVKKIPGYGRKKEMLIGIVGSGWNDPDT